MMAFWILIFVHFRLFTRFFSYRSVLAQRLFFLSTVGFTKIVL
jgi:hypothetical protein